MRLGLFDSGVGGLTVLRSIRAEFPNANLVYLGDTARVPYGTKTPSSIERYAHQAVACLQTEKSVDAVIIACNTASALATATLKQGFPALTLIGVIEPGARAAIDIMEQSHRQSSASHSPLSNTIGVLATESTIQGGAYARAINARSPSTGVVGQACQMLVALAEEGWVDGPVAQLAVERYLLALHEKAGGWPRAIVLGCTHFPLLKPTIRAVADRLGAGDTRIVDSSVSIADHLRQTLGAQLADGAGTTEFMATDGPQRFASVGSTFLGQSIATCDVQVVDIQGY